MSKPMLEEQPGPPFIHIIISSTLNVSDGQFNGY